MGDSTSSQSPGYNKKSFQAASVPHLGVISEHGKNLLTLASTLLVLSVVFNEKFPAVVDHGLGHFLLQAFRVFLFGTIVSVVFIFGTVSRAMLEGEEGNEEGIAVWAKKAGAWSNWAFLFITFAMGIIIIIGFLLNGSKKDASALTEVGIQTVAKIKRVPEESLSIQEYRFARDGLVYIYLTDSSGTSITAAIDRKTAEMQQIQVSASQ